MGNSIDQLKGLISQKGGVAKPNVFRVLLPSIPGATSTEVNLLCKDVQLPGRQIMTNERRIGMKLEKVPYGYAVTDISITFLVLNDYGIKKYFETWQNLAVDQNTFEAGFQRGTATDPGYAFNVTIQQLRKGFSLPVYSTNLGIPKLPTVFQNRLPKIGPFDFAQGEIDLDYITNDDIIYECKLIDAFPTSMNGMQLNNELDGMMELNVQLSYTNWEGNTIGASSNFIQTLVGTAATRLAN